MPVRAVVFDLGGVLSRRVDYTYYRQWEERLGLLPGQLGALVFENEIARRAVLGAATPADVWAYIGQRFELSPTDLDALQADFWKGFEWDLDLLAMLRDLRPRVKTGILSDAWADVRAYAAPYLNDATFDVIMYSAEEGIQKPNPAIFQRLLARLDVAARDTVFVDDRPANIDAARQVGIQGLLFTDSAAIRAEIMALLEQE